MEPLPGGCIRMVFTEPQRAVTPGQAVVFYDGDLVLGGAPSVRDAKGRRESGVLQFLSLTGGPAVLKDQVIHIPAANRLVSHHFISSFAFGFFCQYMRLRAENCTEQGTCLTFAGLSKKVFRFSCLEA